MVDVGAKPVTHRTAHAVAVVELPQALAALLQRGLVEVSATEPGDRVDPARRLRDEIAFRRRFDAIRMAL